MLKILDKYLLREMCYPFLYGFLIILLLVFGNIVYSNLSLIVSRIEQWYLVATYLFCKLPSAMLISLPAGAIFGASISLLRMQRESELTAIKVSGVSNQRIFASIITLGIILTLIGYFFQEIVVVFFEKKAAFTLETLFSIPGDLPIEPNLFVKAGDYCIRVQSITRTKDEKTVYNYVMLYKSDFREYPTQITAKKATEENGYWVLEDGTTIDFNKDSTPNIISRFKILRLKIDTSVFSSFTSSVREGSTYSAMQLKDMVEKNKQAGIPSNSLELEYAIKQAFPLSSLSILFCIVPICLMLPQRKANFGMVIGIVVFFIYWNIMWFSKILGETGFLNPYLSGWSIVIIFSIIGLMLFLRMSRN